MVCFDDDKCRTPKNLLTACRQVTCLPAVEHESELDVAWAQNSCDIYQSQHRKRNDKRMFLLDHHLSSCKQHTSKPHFDFDTAVCLFLNKTADADAPRSFRLYLCVHMSSTDQRSMDCSERDMRLHCSLHYSCRISNALEKPRTRSVDQPVVNRVHEVEYASCLCNRTCVHLYNSLKICRQDHYKPKHKIKHLEE